MHVFSNTAISLDGRVTSGRGHSPGSPIDTAWMSVLRARADAVLVGGATFRRWPLPLVPNPAALKRLADAGFPDVAAPPIEGRRWWNVVVSRSLDLPRSGRFYQDPGARPLFLTSSAGDLPGEWAQAEVERSDPVTVPWILDVLARRGVQTLLIEGGPAWIRAFLVARALNELYLTVCPRVFGGGRPLLDAGGDLPALKLVHAHRFGDEIFTHYQVIRG